MLENSQMHKRMQLLAKVHYRSEGFPRTRLFHPWARDGEGAWWPGKVPCRCRATGPRPGLGQTTAISRYFLICWKCWTSVFW